MGDERARAEDAIEAALRERGGTGQELLGECPYNAIALSDELEERFDDRVVLLIRGLLDMDRAPSPLPVIDPDHHGNAHWWVEMPIGGVWHTLDIASELPDRRGESIIVKGRPEHYVPYKVNPETKYFRPR
ncbi:hypothetical protein [Halorussus sp. AFM4]|uniref:hypothetical protein n=1 Tax=Halorussus sp. AFM4 TaxID=3421651 RepID=UPI003EBA65E8